MHEKQATSKQGTFSIKLPNILGFASLLLTAVTSTAGAAMSMFLVLLLLLFLLLFLLFI